MSDSSNGEGFPRGPGNNIRSILDKRKNFADAAEPVFVDPDLIDFSKFADPEVTRREMIDENAIKTSIETGKHPRSTVQAIAEEMRIFDSAKVDLDNEFEHMTHAKWIQNPARYFVLADEYLKQIDAMAEDILHGNLTSGSPRLGADTAAKTYVHAPTIFLVKMLRDILERDIVNPHINDVAFEYRRRRMNNELG